MNCEMCNLKLGLKQIEAISCQIFWTWAMQEQNIQR